MFCSNDLPFNKDICWIPYNSSLVYPACSLSLVNVLRSASFSLAFDPNCAPTNVNVSWRFLVFKAASIDVAAMLPNSRLTFRASEYVRLKSLASLPAPSSVALRAAVICVIKPRARLAGFSRPDLIWLPIFLNPAPNPFIPDLDISISSLEAFNTFSVSTTSFISGIFDNPLRTPPVAPKLVSISFLALASCSALFIILSNNPSFLSKLPLMFL